MDTSKDCAGQVWIWLWFNDFWQNYASFTMKIIWNFQFPFIISQTVFYIQLKFVWHLDTSKECAGQVRIWSWFDDFWQSYAPFTLKIIWKFSVSVHYLPKRYNTFNSNLTYWYIRGIRRSTPNLFMVQWFLAELCPFYFWKRKFSVSVHYHPNSCTYSTQIL
jgi:hypothetical protein